MDDLQKMQWAFSRYFTVSISGGMGRFVLMVMAVETGDDATYAGSLFQILVFCSQFCDVVLCISWVKMIINTCGSQERWLKIVIKL